MSKRLIAIAVFALAATVAAFAQEAKKEKFYSVVPKHEFTVNGFGGVSTILYKADLGYNTRAIYNSPYWRGEADSDFINIDEGFFHPTGFGGGGGFSYIWHFHPNVGFMTGVDLAYYSGGIRNLCPPVGNFDDGYDQPFTTAYIATSRNSMNSYAVYYGVHNYSEQQKYMALQIPVMLQFMAPMGRGNNHFYFALGARFGFKVYSRYEGMAVTNTNFCGFPVFSTYTYADLPYTTNWRHNGDVDINERTHMVQLYPWYPYFEDLDPEGKYPWYQVSTPITSLSSLENRDSDIYHPKGKWGAKLINVMASAELGFRWRLSDELGLYTAVYADYGIPTVNRKENVALITGVYGEDATGHETHSILNAQTAPVYWTKIDNHSERSYMYDEMRPVASAHTLACGVKVKLAFGKLCPVAHEAPVLSKPDTLSAPARDTVERVLVIRDTVIKVVHDTVYVKNTVIKTVTDTVTIVKEVPVEIQQFMRELSGGLFKTGSSVLNKSTAVGLDKVADWIKSTPNAKIQIAGYTDSVGSDASNLKLSQARAKAVYTYLVSKGCNAKMLSYKGYGKKDPVADNSTAEGRAANRRVELKILNN